jgi:hypothetical protein
MSYCLPLCALSLKWSFQLLLDLGGHRTFISRHGLNDEDLAHELGLAKWIDGDNYSPALALATLRKGARSFNTDPLYAPYPDSLATNLEALGELLGLADAELQVLGFCVLMHTDPTLSDATDQLGVPPDPAAVGNSTSAITHRCQRRGGCRVRKGLIGFPC